mgnify:CR=1 FL=1
MHNDDPEMRTMRTMRTMLGVLVVCQLLQAVAMVLGVVFVAPQAYTLVVQSRRFVDDETRNEVRRILHDVGVVANDLNLVERGVGRALALDPEEVVEEPTPESATFHDLAHSALRLSARIDEIIPMVTRAVSVIDHAVEDHNVSVATLLHRGQRAAERAVAFFDSELPKDALSVAQDMNANVAKLVSMVGAPNGTVAPLLNATARLVPRLNDALDPAMVHESMDP